MKPRTIRLDIDSVVLHGIDPGDREAFATALRNELHALLSDPGAEHAIGDSRALARADGGRINGGSPGQPLAPAVAKAVWRGVSR